MSLHVACLLGSLPITFMEKHDTFYTRITSSRVTTRDVLELMINNYDQLIWQFVELPCNAAVWLDPGFGAVHPDHGALRPNGNNNRGRSVVGFHLSPFHSGQCAQISLYSLHMGEEPDNEAMLTYFGSPMLERCTKTEPGDPLIN